MDVLLVVLVDTSSFLELVWTDVFFFSRLSTFLRSVCLTLLFQRTIRFWEANYLKRPVLLLFSEISGSGVWKSYFIFLKKCFVNISEIDYHSGA